MWFVFPTAYGLGRSEMATKYAIRSMEEAKAYLTHPDLGNRLRECVQLTLQITDRSANQIFAYPDDLKFRSSLTLFKWATEDNEVFIDALDQYFDRKEDITTVDIIKYWQDSIDEI